MKKGPSTRQRIVGRAVAMASLDGVEALTIGTLAGDLGMSKSGLFAHFGSREGLQLAAIDRIVEQFTAEVVRPALGIPPGIGQLRVLTEGWLSWSHAPERPGGCPLAAAAFEFDSQTGPVRDRVASAFALWRRVLVKAIEAGKKNDIREDCDAEALAFAIFGLYFAHHIHRWLLRSTDASTAARESLRALLASSSVKKDARFQASGQAFLTED